MAIMPSKQTTLCIDSVINFLSIWGVGIEGGLGVGIKGVFFWGVWNRGGIGCWNKGGIGC
jgi:hypothetical protein